jgi:peptidoglycan hydrolase CwlO-like protein
MATRKPILAIAIVVVMLISVVGPAAAHSWQTTVTQGPMELGVSSSPEGPVAGMQAEFSARIMDEDIEGDDDRLSWGGVTNQSVEVHIRGPDGYHDHVTAEIPEEDAHFHFTYMFPTDGNYTIAVVTELEGEEYAFEFQRTVDLIPAEATGEEMEHMSEEVHHIGEDTSDTNDQVKDVHSKVDSLQGQVDDLNSQVDSLESQLEEQDSTQSSNQLPGMGIGAALAGLVGAVAFIAGRRF